MKKKENLTENIKVRLAPAEKQALESVARAEQASVSSLIRSALSEPKNINEMVLKYRCCLERNRIYNHIALMSIPEDIKAQILKEVSELE